MSFNKKEYYGNMTAVSVQKDVAWQLRSKKGEIEQQLKTKLSWSEFFQYLLKQSK